MLTSFKLHKRKLKTLDPHIKGFPYGYLFVSDIAPLTSHSHAFHIHLILKLFCNHKKNVNSPRLKPHFLRFFFSFFFSPIPQGYVWQLCVVYQAPSKVEPGLLSPKPYSKKERWALVLLMVVKVDVPIQVFADSLTSVESPHSFIY